MEVQKIRNLLDNTEIEYSKFATKNGMSQTVNPTVTIQKIKKKSL